MTHPTSRKGRLSARVRVRELDSVADELQSLDGTITQDYAAQGVLLDGGSPRSCYGTDSWEDEAPRGCKGNAECLPFTEVTRTRNGRWSKAVFAP